MGKKLRASKHDGAGCAEGHAVEHIVELAIQQKNDGAGKHEYNPDERNEDALPEHGVPCRLRDKGRVAASDSV